MPFNSKFKKPKVKITLGFFDRKRKETLDFFPLE